MVIFWPISTSVLTFNRFKKLRFGYAKIIIFGVWVRFEYPIKYSFGGEKRVCIFI
jgi:hypothetical protein